MIVEIISNHPFMIDAFGKLFDVFDKKVFFNRERARSVRSMKLYAMIVGDDGNVVDDIIDDSITIDAEDDFIDFFKNGMHEKGEFFISTVTEDEKGTINYVYTTVVGLNPSVDGDTRAVSLKYPVVQFIHLFKDLGIVPEEDVDHVILDVLDYVAMEFPPR